MVRRLKVCNLDFLHPTDFEPFEVVGYRFFPIEGRQPPELDVRTAAGFLRYHRRHIVTAMVEVPAGQPRSVIRPGGLRDGRPMPLLYDVLTVTSILMGRNVVPWSDRPFTYFPPTASNHSVKVASNSTMLAHYLEVAMGKVLDDGWRALTGDGFHLRLMLNASNTLSAEARFLSEMALWEFVYAYATRNELETEREEHKRLARTRLDDKLATLLGSILLEGVEVGKEKVRVFTHTRNQLAHHGRLPVTHPDAPQWLSTAPWSTYGDYFRFFDRLTQVLVLKALGLELIDHPAFDTFNVRERLTEILATGRVQGFGP